MFIKIITYINPNQYWKMPIKSIKNSNKKEILDDVIVFSFFL